MPFKIENDPSYPFASVRFAVFSPIREAPWQSQRICELLGGRRMQDLAVGPHPEATPGHSDEAGIALTIEDAQRPRALGFEDLNKRARGMTSQVLCPIGVLHLYRQHIYEGTTFLGPSVDHVWLSPGSTLELAETRFTRTATERSSETTQETRSSREDASNDLSELTQRLTTQRSADSRIGVSVSASGGIGVVSSSASMNASAGSSSQQAHEEMRKNSHQVSSKITQEQRITVKTAVKTSSEASMTAQRRHLLSNTTNALISYALHQKMRKVKMRAQFIGTRLCWITYVSRPARLIGTPGLLSVSAPDDLAQLAAGRPSSPADLKPEAGEFTFDMFQGDPEEKEFEIGNELAFDISMLLPKNTQLDRLQMQDAEQNSYVGFRYGDRSGKQVVVTKVKGPNGYGTHKCIAYYMPLPGAAETWERKQQEYQAALSDWQTAVRDAGYRAFIESARARIESFGRVSVRDTDTLRQEERIALLRNAMWHLLGASSDPAPLLSSEVLAQLFDFDDLFYFLAPDWYAPSKGMMTASSQGQQEPTGELGDFRQRIGEDPVANDEVKLDTFTADWGRETMRSAYAVTENSAPAELGAGLGWLIQIDGDQQRQAFLNAPYVKAVIPLRPGHEREALEWLKLIEGIAEDDTSMEPLVDSISKQHEKEAHRLRAIYEGAAPPADSSGAGLQIPPDHGVFSEWYEVIPTAQLVPVPVEY